MAVPFDANAFRQQMSGKSGSPQAVQPPQGQFQQQAPQAHMPEQFTPVAPPPHPSQGQPQQAYAPRPYPQMQQAQPHQAPAQHVQAPAPVQQPYTQPPLQPVSGQASQGYQPVQPRMFTPPPTSAPEVAADVPRKKKFSLKRKRRTNDVAKMDQGAPAAPAMNTQTMVPHVQNVALEALETRPQVSAKAGKPPALVFAAGLIAGVIGTMAISTIMGGLMSSKVDQRFDEVAATGPREMPVEGLVIVDEETQDLSQLQNQLKVAEGLKTP